MITNPNRTVLYIGVTNNLARRLVEHYANKGTNNSFAGKYYCYSLVYCEHFQYIKMAIAREKELKKWNRKRKEALIATKNPEWNFYNEFFCKEWPPREKWGKYLEKFKNRKKNNKLTANSTTTIEDDPICIYKDELKNEATTSSSETINHPPTETQVKNSLISIEKQIWKNSVFSERERYLMIISILITKDEKEALKELLSTLPPNTFSITEMEALFVHLGLYIGLPLAKSARTIWESVSANEQKE